MKTPLYIDTDAGTDDAVALIMALRHPAIEVKGISCVGGNVSLDHVVQNVLYLVEECQSKVTVHVGAAQPMKRVLETADFIHGSDGMGDIGLKLSGRKPDSYNAVNHIIQTARELDGTLQFICLGPMTNLAHTIEQYPEIEDLIDHLYIMGGLYRMPGNVTPVSEYNLWADPEAAKICINSKIDKTVIGWDITLTDGYLTVDEVDELREYPTPLAKVAADIQNIKLQWLQDNEQDVVCYLPDPLAMAAVIDPEIITQHGSYHCDVVCSGDMDDTRGMLIVDVNGIKKKRVNTRLVHQASHERFKEVLFNAFKS